MSMLYCTKALLEQENKMWIGIELLSYLCYHYHMAGERGENILLSCNTFQFCCDSI